MPTFIDIQLARFFIEKGALPYYQSKNVPPWFLQWLGGDESYENNLYNRLGEKIETVSAVELLNLQCLYMDGDWLPPSIAVNRIYKMLHELGQDTTGMVDF